MSRFAPGEVPSMWPFFLYAVFIMAILVVGHFRELAHVSG